MKSRISKYKKFVFFLGLTLAKSSATSKTAPSSQTEFESY